jgi:thymidine phosphorylase
LKVGLGAFMPDLQRARELGELLRNTALAFGRRCSVLFSAMDAPLGRTVGNAPEVAEALELLSGGGPLLLRDLAVELAAEMALLAGAAGQRQEAVLKAEAALSGGSALELFLRMAAAQGGRLDEGSPGWGLPRARCEARVTAGREGYLLPPDARAVGRIGVELGAGRQKSDDAVDPAAGILFLPDAGELSRPGEVLALVQGSDGARVERAAQALQELLVLGEAPGVRPSSLIMARLDGTGFHPCGASAGA